MARIIEKVLLIQDLNLLRFASTEHLALLASACREGEVPPDTVIYRRGEPNTELLFLLEGKVELEWDGGRTEIVERRVMGYWSFFAEAPHRATARTLERCQMLSISFEDMVDLLTAEPELCWALMKALARNEVSA